MSKREPAPCGHEGEVVIGSYVRCLTKGCDGKAPEPVPEHVERETTDKLWYVDTAGRLVWTRSSGTW